MFPKSEVLPVTTESGPTKVLCGSHPYDTQTPGPWLDSRKQVLPLLCPESYTGPASFRSRHITWTRDSIPRHIDTEQKLRVFAFNFLPPLFYFFFFFLLWILFLFFSFFRFKRFRPTLRRRRNDPISDLTIPSCWPSTEWRRGVEAFSVVPDRKDRRACGGRHGKTRICEWRVTQSIKVTVTTVDNNSDTLTTTKSRRPHEERRGQEEDRGDKREQQIPVRRKRSEPEWGRREVQRRQETTRTKEGDLWKEREGRGKTLENKVGPSPKIFGQPLNRIHCDTTIGHNWEFETRVVLARGIRFSSLLLTVPPDTVQEDLWYWDPRPHFRRPQGKPPQDIRLTGQRENERRSVGSYGHSSSSSSL